MKALILCAGLGTRLQPLTYTTPKTLLPIANRPVLSYILEDLARVGVFEIGIVVDSAASPIVRYVSAQPPSDLRIRFLVQAEPLGLAHAVQTGRDFIGGEPFAVYLGDCFAPGGASELLAAHRQERTSVTIALQPVANPSHFGIVELVGGKVRSIQEKPAKPRGNLAIAGLYAFEPDVFEVLEQLTPSRRNEYELTDALQVLLDRGMRVGTVVMSGRWHDIGRPDDLLMANAYSLRQLPARRDGVVRDCVITDNVAVGQGSEVASSVLRGPIVIGRDCRILNSHIGPFTSIGDGSEIQRSEVRGSILMRGVRLNGVRGLDASVVGNGCRLGGALARSLRVRAVVADRTAIWVGEDDTPRSTGNGSTSWLDRGGQPI